MTTNDQTNTQTEAIRDRLSIPRQPVPKQNPGDRINNFDETYLRMDMSAAIVEASRCIDLPLGALHTGLPRPQ